MFWIRRGRESNRENFGRSPCCSFCLPVSSPQIYAWIRIFSSSLVFPKLNPAAKWQGHVGHGNYCRATRPRWLFHCRLQEVEMRSCETINFQLIPNVVCSPHLLISKSEPNENYKSAHTTHLSHLHVSQPYFCFSAIHCCHLWAKAPKSILVDSSRFQSYR